jgi:hypothetical protein
VAVDVDVNVDVAAPVVVDVHVNVTATVDVVVDGLRSSTGAFPFACTATTTGAATITEKSGGAVARTGLRMMPTFPPPP